MARRRNPWVSVGEVLTWVLFAALLFPAGFAGWAVGHYTSLGGAKSSAPQTVTQTTTVTQTVTATTAAATTAAATTAAATTSAATTATPTTTSAANAPGDATKGEAVFASAGCGSCHAFKPAGASGSIGPDLDTRPAQDAKQANMQLVPFLRQSIVDPNAFIAPGYSKGLMPQGFGTQLSKSQLDDLVAFLASGAK